MLFVLAVNYSLDTPSQQSDSHSFALVQVQTIIEITSRQGCASSDAPIARVLGRSLVLVHEFAQDLIRAIYGWER